MPFQFFNSATDGAPSLKIPALGLDLAVRLPPEVSGEALTVLETSNAPGFGPPLHRQRETEVFRVLEGRYLYEVNGRRFEAAAGNLVRMPGGDAHAFINMTDNPARQLLMMLSGSGRATLFPRTRPGSEKGHPDRNELNLFGRPRGVEFLGPPLSVKGF